MRELLATDEVRARARRAAHDAAVGLGAVGAARRGPDLRRHGVVAAVAQRRRAPAARSAALERDRRARSSRAGCATAPRSCSTRRPRSREALAKTWGATLDPETTPRLSLPFDRLLAHTKAQTGPGAQRARRSRHAVVGRDRIRSGGRRHRRARPQPQRGCGRPVTACSSPPRAAGRRIASSSCSSARA